MGYRVNERVLLLIPANFTDQEEGIQHDAADQHRAQHHAQEKQNPAAPSQVNPAYIEENDDRDEGHAESDEESDRLSAAGHYHDYSSLREPELGCPREAPRRLPVRRTGCGCWRP